MLFDDTKGETEGNADWIVAGTGSGPTREPEIVPQPENPALEGDWDGALSSWGVELSQRGIDINTLKRGERLTFGDRTNPADLSLYNVLVIPEPNVAFTDEEKRAILQYVEQGGGLFMIAYHGGSDRNNDGLDSAAIWNDLMNQNPVRANPFGIQFDGNSVNERSNSLGDFNDVHVQALLNGPAGRVSTVRYRAGSTMTINPAGNPNVRGVVFQSGVSPSGSVGVMVALSRFGRGRVVGIGDSSTCSDGTGDTSDRLLNGWSEPGVNHREFFINATIWLTQASQRATEPAIIGLDPDRAFSGTPETINIYGRNTNFAVGLTRINFGLGIQLEGVHIVGPRVIQASVIVDPAVSGRRDVLVTTVNESVVAPSALFLPGGLRPSELIINEALVRVPDGVAGDANGDGMRDAAEDQFVELVNAGAQALDIGGYEVDDSDTPGSFVFPAGTTIPGGEAAVVFGSIDLDRTPLEFGNARALRLIFGTGLPAPYFGFSRSGDSVIVRRSRGGAEVTRLDYTSDRPVPQPTFQSFNRNPDLTGPFDNHSAVPRAAGRLFSPGTRVDGRPFSRTILNVTPDNVPVMGGPNISIIGRGFGRRVISVSFGGRDSPSFERLSALRISAKLPAANFTGPADVLVKDEMGQIVGVDAISYSSNNVSARPGRR